jgi:hypothetical protein|tara:strand:- start:1865 stop:2176 length:312 start_codon:yes stop_codon:yes gene_type:complete
MSIAARDSITSEVLQTLAPGTCQRVTTSGSSAATSSGFSAGTTVVRLVATEDVHFVFGASPTADDTKSFLPAKQVEYFKVTAGDKCAAIQSSAGGYLYVTEMT